MMMMMICRTSFRKSRDTLLTETLRTPSTCADKILKKNVVKVNYKDRTQTLAASPKVGLTRKDSRSLHTYCTRTAPVLAVTSETIYRQLKREYLPYV